MLQSELIIPTGILLIAIITLIFIRAVKGRSRSEQPAKEAESAAGDNSTQTGQAVTDQHSTPETDELMLELWRLAFDSKELEYTIAGEHAKVLKIVREEIPKAISVRTNFPRRPMIIPKLMAAIKNDESSLNELVKIISQDPVITGDVLRLANGAFYRISEEPVETLGRAIVLLGTDGLRSLVAHSVMQPIFEVPTGYYENFAPLVWDLSTRSAVAAQAWARATKSCDSFSAHLIVLIHYISYIVLFKITADVYQRKSGLLPRPEVFTHVLAEQVDRLARLISEDWELPENMQQAFSESEKKAAPDNSGTLAKAALLGRMVGLSSLLHSQGILNEDQVRFFLESKGIPTNHVNLMWQSAKGNA